MGLQSFRFQELILVLLRYVEGRVHPRMKTSSHPVAIESRLKFHSTQDVSGALQENSNAAFLK